MAHKDCYDKNAFYGTGLIYRKEILLNFLTS